MRSTSEELLQIIYLYKDSPQKDDRLATYCPPKGGDNRGDGCSIDPSFGVGAEGFADKAVNLNPSIPWPVRGVVNSGELPSTCVIRCKEVETTSTQSADSTQNNAVISKGVDFEVISNVVHGSRHRIKAKRGQEKKVQPELRNHSN